MTARARLGVGGDVRFLGWVSGEELEGLWALADAFVFPSLYEGFGLPVLEAMARGVPVACSNASSLPEVAGDAALMFDPHDERAIAGAIEALLSTRRHRARAYARARPGSRGAVHLGAHRAADACELRPRAGHPTGRGRSGVRSVSSASPGAHRCLDGGDEGCHASSDA